MKTSHAIGLACIALFIIITGIIIAAKKPDTDPVVEVQPVASVTGCYVAMLSKDVYTLNVQSQTDEQVSGTLSFKNFQKDSSSGTFAGIYKDGILLADYSFQSEGMNSVLQVAFKKSPDGFVRGFGDMDSTGTRFADVANLTYDDTQVFKASSDCGTPAVSQGKLPAGSTPPAAPAAIQSKTWVWQKTIMSDGAVITPKKAGAFTLTLGTDGKATGKTDCNSFFASYKIGTDGVIAFGGIGSTLMFCEGSQESVFTGQIAKANQYMVDASGNLVLMLPYDSGSILFRQ